MRCTGFGILVHSADTSARRLTNIVEQITVHGTTAPPRAPTLRISEAEEVGELVADGVAAGRFLILTAPEAAEELAAHGADMDGYLARMAEELA